MFALFALVIVMAVAVAAAIGRHAVRQAHEMVPAIAEPSNPAWRLLTTDEELQAAIERAIACEAASAGSARVRSARFAAMRSGRSSTD